MAQELKRKVFAPAVIKLPVIAGETEEESDERMREFIDKMKEAGAEVEVHDIYIGVE